MITNRMKFIPTLACCLMVLLGTTSCTDKEYIWDELPTERIMALLTETSETLNDQDGVWRAAYSSDLGSTSFTFYFDGTTDVAMYEQTDSSFSTYNLNYGEGPMITFDTYGLIHDYANPSSDSPYGNGGDYEFIIYSVCNDSIVTKGRVYDNEVVFKRATIGEEFRMRFMMQLNLALGISTNYFWGITSTVGGVEFDVEQTNDEATLLVTDANQSTQEIAITTDNKGLVFTPAIDLAGTTASRLDWNYTTGAFDYNDFTMKSLNYPTHSLGETAAQLSGMTLTLAEVSPSLSTVYANLYADESLGYMIETIELSIPEDTEDLNKMDFDNRVIMSVVLDVPISDDETELSWNTFISGYSWTLGSVRGDCMMASHSMRKGDYVADIYTIIKTMVSTVQDSQGCTVDIIGDNYYFISRSDSKNWMRFVPSTFEYDEEDETTEE